ncbi:MAG: hypothetical protein ACXAEF_16565 [Candidatus Thorarchaeota archaeon]
MVHPDGNWINIGSYGGGHDGTFHKSSTTGGIIEAGFNSTFKLVLSLTPSWRFLEDNGTEPWKLYHGSVLVTFYNVSLNALYRSGIDFPNPVEPLYEKSWKQGEYDWYEASCITPEGYTYVITTYYDDDLGSGTSLTKFNPQTKVVWNKTINATYMDPWIDMVPWDDGIEWWIDDLAFYSDRVYLVGLTEVQEGGSNLVLMALDQNGDLVWSTTVRYTLGVLHMICGNTSLII